MNSEIVGELIKAMATIIAAAIGAWAAIKVRPNPPGEDSKKEPETRVRPQRPSKPIWLWGIGGAIIGAGLVLAAIAFINPPTMIALRTSHNRYVTAGDGGSNWNWELRAETKTLGDWEKFKLLCLDDGKVAFETHHGTYVTAGDGGSNWNWKLRAETKTLDDWEKFTIVDVKTETDFSCSGLLRQLEQNDVVIALKTHHERYVTAMDNQLDRNWEIRAEREVSEGIGASEKFTVIPLP